MELTTIIVAAIGLVGTVVSTWIASKKHTQSKNTNRVLQNVQEVYEKMLKGQSDQNFELMAHITKSSSVIAELHNTNQLLMKANYAVKEEKYQLEFEIKGFKKQIADLRDEVVDLKKREQESREKELLNRCFNENCLNRIKDKTPSILTNARK